MMVEMLRRKFIVISVSAVFVVILMIGLFSNAFNYSQIGKNSEIILRILAENDGNFPEPEVQAVKPDLPPRVSPEVPFYTRFFTIKIDDQKQVMEVNTDKIASVSRENAIAYADSILKSGKKSGLADEFKYNVVTKDYGSLLIFVSLDRELEIFYSFLENSIIIGSIAIFMVFLIILIFSKKAIAPIAESYEKQKQFITDASHELKTPLTIISTNAEVIEMSSGESQWTKSIHNQVHRLSKLIESLVSLTRMDEEKNQLIKNDFSLSQVVEETAEAFLEMGLMKGKELIIRVEKEINYDGNEDSIRQLVSILLDNALKYGLKNEPILISLKRQGKKYVIQTINKSENLRIQNYDMLFERFYREDLSRNSQLEGYGIGLSIAKAIVLKHKGKITAESLDGKRMIFTIQL
ncbi:HAMP domain-containing histidine kinase [Jeotgalibaca sp. MA1X17-3]|uniref:sensor histidine kinase n=1 Tax=Jeotgalibaca sp. MA1X17-3 TaxID=2908211 RepID=UPI001F1760DC|nr:HAMP domain-containing sensor histidine kinase [Jeotgalibaca sp. MA1X17-3]UJF16258.1 HAMP domain-containing histidine kinase [Jeotgalibaca sp. MA1X17-3]